MLSTPTKRQATNSNAVNGSSVNAFSTPPPSAGSISPYVSEDIKARLASRAKEIRCSVSRGYPLNYSPRAPLSTTRSEPNILYDYGNSSTHSPSPYSSAPQGNNSAPSQFFTPPRALMPMCESVLDGSSMYGNNTNTGAWDGSMASILKRAQQDQDMYRRRMEQNAAEALALRMEGNPFASTSTSTTFGSGPPNNSMSFLQYPSPVSLNGKKKKKRAEMEDEEEEGMGGQAAKMANLQDGEEMMEDNAEEDMMQDDDLPLSRNRNAWHNEQVQQNHNPIPNLFPTTFSATGLVGNGNSPVQAGLDALQSNGPSGLRQTRSLPRRTLGKTQSLPVEAFMSQVQWPSGTSIHPRASGLPQAFPSDVFNTQDGF